MVGQQKAKKEAKNAKKEEKQAEKQMANLHRQAQKAANRGNLGKAIVLESKSNHARIKADIARDKKNIALAQANAMNRHDQRLLSDLSDSFRSDLSLVESSILSPLGISAIRPKTNIHVVHHCPPSANPNASYPMGKNIAPPSAQPVAQTHFPNVQTAPPTPVGPIHTAPAHSTIAVQTAPPPGAPVASYQAPRMPTAAPLHTYPGAPGASYYPAASTAPNPYTSPTYQSPPTHSGYAPPTALTSNQASAPYPSAPAPTGYPPAASTAYPTPGYPNQIISSPSYPTPPTAPSAPTFPSQQPPSPYSTPPASAPIHPPQVSTNQSAPTPRYPPYPAYPGYPPN